MRHPITVKRRGAPRPLKREGAKKSLNTALGPVHRPQKPPRPSKLGKILALLARPQGAALGELVRATGWQRHSSGEPYRAPCRSGWATNWSAKRLVQCAGIALLRE